MAKNCNAIRQQIDEVNLADQLPVAAVEHLRHCADCRRFHDERRELRVLMAGLGTVGAPADFDFHLRARLAREKSQNGFASFLSARQLAAVALVILIAVAAVVLKNRISLERPFDQTASNSSAFSAVQSSSPAKGAPANSGVLSVADTKPNEVTRSGSVDRQPNSRPFRSVGGQRLANTAARDDGAAGIREFSLGPAPVVTPGAAEGALVVVPVDVRAFRVSIDNGHGGARTISLPPVSFGSQRLLAREANYLPASAARGDW